MKVRCKSSFKIGNSTNFIAFEKDEWYDCEIEFHKETGTKLYYLSGQPILERTFKANFDDIQFKRNEKLNQLLGE